VEEEDGSTEIAFFELTREALPGALGISLYTSPDGELQRRHLEHLAMELGCAASWKDECLLRRPQKEDRRSCREGDA
jgi:hypothetical protein